MKKPRHFSHSPIYIDERRQRLNEIEQRARHELGLDDASSYNPQRLQGVFTNRKRPAKHRLTVNSKLTSPVFGCLLLFVLIIIWKLLS